MIKAKPKEADSAKYFEGTGRRKTAVARVRISAGKGAVVNGKDYKEYFTIERLRRSVESPLALLELTDNFHVSAKVKGGGPAAQAGAVRHGITRSLLKYDMSLKKKLSREGYVTRDPRMVERKKYGLKKARRAPQWSKR